MDITPKVKATKAKINKWDYSKLKRNSQQNEKATYEMRENICKRYV